MCHAVKCNQRFSCFYSLKTPSSFWKWHDVTAWCHKWTETECVAMTSFSKCWFIHFDICWLSRLPLYCCTRAVPQWQCYPNSSIKRITWRWTTRIAMHQIQCQIANWSLLILPQWVHRAASGSDYDDWPKTTIWSIAYFSEDSFRTLPLRWHRASIYILFDGMRWRKGLRSKFVMRFVGLPTFSKMWCHDLWRNQFEVSSFCCTFSQELNPCDKSLS